MIGNDKSFLEIIAANLANCGCDPVIAVLGAESDKVRVHARILGIDLVENERWQLGQFSSLKTGLMRVPIGYDGVMMTLVDCPMVIGKTYARLYQAFEKERDKIIVPVYQGRRGHPVVLPAKMIDEIKTLTDNNNLRDQIRHHDDITRTLVVDDPGILHDIDTKEDLKAL